MNKDREEKTDYPSDDQLIFGPDKLGRYQPVLDDNPQQCLSTSDLQAFEKFEKGGLRNLSMRRGADGLHIIGDNRPIITEETDKKSAD